MTTSSLTHILSGAAFDLDRHAHMFGPVPAGDDSVIAAVSRSGLAGRGGGANLAIASISSLTLCGGIDVAMPTAMPCAPLACKFGNAPGSTTGSRDCPS